MSVSERNLTTVWWLVCKQSLLQTMGESSLVFMWQIVRLKSNLSRRVLRYSTNLIWLKKACF